MKPILSCHNLTKNFGSISALSHLDLQLGRGEIVGLLGPNGSGKTTFIKLINDLISPTSGSIMVNGLSPSVETRKIISYLPERTYLNEWMRVKDTLQFFQNFYQDFNRENAEKMLHDLSIDLDKRIRTLSKGTKEKVQLILVMSRKAQLYVLDEPIGGVDPASRDYIIHSILTNYNPEATVLISTHLITDVESILDRVIFLKNGTIFLNETVDDLRQQHSKSVDDLFREVFKC